MSGARDQDQYKFCFLTTLCLRLQTMTETVAVTHINVIIRNLVLLLEHAHGLWPFSLTLDSVPLDTFLTPDTRSVSGFS